MRDLERAGLVAVRAVRQQLSAFLLRHDRICPKPALGPRRIGAGLADRAAWHIVVEQSIEAIRLAEARATGSTPP